MPCMCCLHIPINVLTLVSRLPTLSPLLTTPAPVSLHGTQVWVLDTGRVKENRYSPDTHMQVSVKLSERPFLGGCQG